LNGAGDRSATAIHFYTDAPNELGCIYGVTVDNVAMQNLLYGIRMQQSNVGWIACNHFSNMSIYAATYQIHMAGSGSGRSNIYNNMFANMSMEIGALPPPSTGIYCDGWQNYFKPIMMWDVDQINSVSINCPTYSMDNHFEGRLEAPIIDNGSRNVFTNYGW